MKNETESERKKKEIKIRQARMAQLVAHQPADPTIQV